VLCNGRSRFGMRAHKRVIVEQNSTLMVRRAKGVGQGKHADERAFAAHLEEVLEKRVDPCSNARVPRSRRPIVRINAGCKIGEE